MWKAVLLEMVADDVGNGDVTSNSTIPKDAQISAEILAHRPGTAAGISEACWLFEKFGISATPKVRDGSRFSANTPLISLRGNARKIFAIERTALNILGRLCGIATATAYSVAILHRAHSTAKIAATRKTLLPHLDKKAVVLGGGWSHRWGLDDMVLIKSSHLRLAGSVKEAVAAARKSVGRRMKIEIEVSTPAQALEAARCGADIVMLDNFTPRKIDASVRLLKSAGLRKKVKLELSGGITPANLPKFAKLGADIISMGWLTHSTPWLDVSLRILRK